MIMRFPRPDVADEIEHPDSMAEIVDLAERMFPFHSPDGNDVEQVIHIVGAWLRGARA
jgi:hypothetical protein